MDINPATDSELLDQTVKCGFAFGAGSRWTTPGFTSAARKEAEKALYIVSGSVVDRRAHNPDKAQSRFKFLDFQNDCSTSAFYSHIVLKPPKPSPKTNQPTTDIAMSSFHVYTLDGFSMYLMPRAASAPGCPACQSDTLPSVFEDDDDGEQLGKLSKVNKALKQFLLARSKRASLLKFLSSTRIRSSLTLSPRSSGSATPSFTSKTSS
ncbi:hypothetical protein PCANC_23473 [Puccinia coronata f. sp. avenae]|uniref:Uncharacterized protein n=1 Tax=Puccinia coronata f. sp. avenae TaxID=200324 RepID=A0A2N5TUD7_9BASI|nr:hypothetical protein PCANC_23473 [Puccinia coronata f. sp. avenae]